MGFKRSVERMKSIDRRMRDGMAAHGIVGKTADDIALAITSFALYGFPESHAASFALLAYASAYLKVHYPAAFYTALLNNQPMGFYHPSTLVKDAQRRGVRFHPIDVQVSDWDCTVEADGAIRLGLRYVHGLREQIGRTIASASTPARPAPPAPPAPVCPKCGCDDETMMERTDRGWFCNVCSHDWNSEQRKGVKHKSLDELIARTGLRRDEVVTLADVGALNAFGYDRRSALWQAERAVRPSGELFDEQLTAETAEPAEIFFEKDFSAASASSAVKSTSYIGGSSWYCHDERLYHGAGASQSHPRSPIGAPGGASGAGSAIGRCRSIGRSRKRLMSAAISVRCAVSSSVLLIAVFARAASFDSFIDAMART